jgi:predicted O-methyltransferase YrrM
MAYDLNIEGWMSENELQVIEQLALIPQNNGVVAEVGSWMGRSAVCWAMTAHPSTTIYCFDPFNRLDKFVENTSQFKNIIPVKGLVPSQAVYTDPRPIDVFFVDSDHKNPNEWEVIKHFLPFVRTDGIIAGHDYTVYRKNTPPTFPDVNLNVHRLEEMFNQKARIIDKLWYFRKPKRWDFDIDRYE